MNGGFFWFWSKEGRKEGRQNSRSPRDGHDSTRRPHSLRLHRSRAAPFPPCPPLHCTAAIIISPAGEPCVDTARMRRKAWGRGLNKELGYVPQTYKLDFNRQHYGHFSLSSTSISNNGSLYPRLSQGLEDNVLGSSPG